MSDFGTAGRELNGTLSNREVLLEAAQIVVLKRRLLQKFLHREEGPAPPTRRAGLIKQTIIRVLIDAPGPMRVTEIRRDCEQRLGIAVNRSTVSDCLIKHSSGERRLFERDARGSYHRHRGFAAPVGAGDPA